MISIWGCSKQGQVVFTDELLLCDENGVKVMMHSLDYDHDKQKVTLELGVENNCSFPLNIAFNEIRVNGLANQGIKTGQYMTLDNNTSAMKEVVIDYHDIAFLGIDDIKDITSMTFNIDAHSIQSPFVQPLNKPISIYPFGIAKYHDMQEELMSLKVYDGEDMTVYYLGYDQDDYCKFYVQSKLDEEIAPAFYLTGMDGKEIGYGLTVIKLQGEAIIAGYAKEAPENSFNVRYDIYHSAYTYQGEPLLKGKFMVENVENGYE
ncbi:MAG: hypothetical protein MR210_01570 [Erysipelotrichaceae bacterium]|nr:hypothetical protein [Erysipelotrichaceae bacterium]